MMAEEPSTIAKGETNDAEIAALKIAERISVSIEQEGKRAQTRKLAEILGALAATGTGWNTEAAG